MDHIRIRAKSAMSIPFNLSIHTVSSEHVPPVNVQIHMMVVLKFIVLRNKEYAGI
jgi:hypothetical protein